MKLTLERFSLLAFKAERYLRVAMTVFAIALVLISPDGLETGGGTGR